MQSAHKNARVLIAAALASMGMVGSAQAIEFVFDYGTDTQGFMTDEKKAILEAAAAQIEARIADSLGAIAPTDQFSPSIFTSAPETGGSMPGPTSVGANQIYVYVGARDLFDQTERALAGDARNATRPAGMPSSDPDYVAYRESLRSRGQEGYTTTTDFSPWGGALAFNSTIDYYVDTDLSTADDIVGVDFYTAALRGLIGMLGYGSNGNSVGSYQRYVDGDAMVFTGPEASAVNGDSVYLAVYELVDEEGNVSEVFDDRRLDDTVVSTVNGAAQGALMTLTLNAGERRQITALDEAILKDMGWQVTAVPEPSEYALFLAGLGVIAAVARRRKV
ncbi:PEP-CTERM sorting domain-containing protein [Methyloversatilis thermotolerans]|uniref:PEP-CTERM sorting domain-containing protein n=1 Tax=Methyloversatilis thermotolerans TaxID=1346290 RepID=UPI00036612F6|nr:PEP-CTERM sorting domain-containing protein [Methyloversatilis thermotolerans]